MARAFAKSFYRSKEWARVREYVLLRDRYLCRDCGRPAREVHHIVHLNEHNIWDIKVALNPDNLVSLCRDCHMARHRRESSVLPEIAFDAAGNPVKVPRR